MQLSSQWGGPTGQQPGSSGFGDFNWSSCAAGAIAGLPAAAATYGASSVLACAAAGLAGGSKQTPAPASSGPALNQVQYQTPQPAPKPAVPTWVWLAGGGVVLLGIVAVAATR